MSDIEFVIKKSKALEALLEAEFRAEGKGLHEKLTSVQSRLPEPLVKKLRFIATMRNKLVHDSRTDRLDDRRRFEDTCDDAESQLRTLARPALAYTSSGTGCAVIIALLNAVVAASVLLSWGF